MKDIEMIRNGEKELISRVIMNTILLELCSSSGELTEESVKMYQELSSTFNTEGEVNVGGFHFKRRQDTNTARIETIKNEMVHHQLRLEKLQRELDSLT